MKQNVLWFQIVMYDLLFLIIEILKTTQDL